MWHTKPYSSTQKSMRWWWRISTVTNRMEESHNWRQWMQSKRSSVMVRKVPKPASSHRASGHEYPETAKCAVSVTLLTNLRTVQHLAKSPINVVLRIISARVADLHGVTDKTQTDAEVEHQHACRSTERCHRPSRGRHSRSRSRSRSGSQTRNAHIIEIDRYDIDDIDVLRTFHSISRSRSVAAISNDTDPDGKMKILTKLWVKLPHQEM